MTLNQLELLKYQETVRSNLAEEAINTDRNRESERHNRATETAEGNRLAESARQANNSLAESARQADTRLAEEVRSNQARETETNRHNTKTERQTDEIQAYQKNELASKTFKNYASGVTDIADTALGIAGKLIAAGAF